MPKKGPVCNVTPEEAKFVWESMRYPSAAKVSAALRAAGRHVSGRAIIDWRRQGWKHEGPIDDESRRGSQLQKAAIELNAAVPVLTRDASVQLDQVVGFSTEFPRSTSRTDKVRLPVKLVDNRSLVEMIDGMTDIQLLREVNRRAQGICMAIFNEVDIQRKPLVGETPDALGNLFRAMSSFLEAANTGAKHFLDIEERKMRVVNPNNQRGRGALEDDELDPGLDAAFSPTPQETVEILPPA